MRRRGSIASVGTAALPAAVGGRVRVVSLSFDEGFKKSFLHLPGLTWKARMGDVYGRCQDVYPAPGA